MNKINISRQSPVPAQGNANGSDGLSVRIELARILLISAIVFHHIRIPAELNLYSWDNLGYLRGFLQIGIFKTATSTLTVVSGYLCFSKTFEAAPRKFVLKKFKTLFVPLVLWNIPIAAIIFYDQSIGLYANKFDDLSSGDVFNWLNALLGLTREPADAPLHFLRNLIMCNALALAIAGLYRRHALTVFAVIVAIGLFDLDGNIFTRNDIMIGFFFGGLAAVCEADIDYFDGWLAFTIPAYLAGAFLIFYLNVNYESLLWLPHRALGFLVSWPLIGRLAKTNAGAEISKYSKYAFFIFLAHYYVVIILFKVFDRMFSMDQFYIYFIFCFPLTILICISTQKIMHRFFPKALSLATGNRIVARI